MFLNRLLKNWMLRSLTVSLVLVGCSQPPDETKPERPTESVSASDDDLPAVESSEDTSSTSPPMAEAVLQEELPVESASPPRRPPLRRNDIDAIATGTGNMFELYDLKFDYDLAAVSDSDYAHLDSLRQRAEQLEAAQRQQQALDNAYRAAASGGESTSFRFDSNAIFSKPSSRLKTLKSIIDDARRSPKN